MTPLTVTRILLLIIITINVIVLLMPENKTPTNIIIWLISSFLAITLTTESIMLIYVSHNTISKIRQRYRTFTSRLARNIRLSKVNKCRQLIGKQKTE